MRRPPPVTYESRLYEDEYQYPEFDQERPVAQLYPKNMPIF